MVRFYVEEQSINLKVNRTIASDTINFVKLEFVFCESWKGYNKTVQFTQCTNTYSINEKISNKCFCLCNIFMCFKGKIFYYFFLLEIFIKIINIFEGCWSKINL